MHAHTSASRPTDHLLTFQPIIRVTEDAFSGKTLHARIISRHAHHKWLRTSRLTTPSCMHGLASVDWSISGCRHRQVLRLTDSPTGRPYVRRRTAGRPRPGTAGGHITVAATDRLTADRLRVDAEYPEGWNTENTDWEYREYRLGIHTGIQRIQLEYRTQHGENTGRNTGIQIAL